jgi:Subtilase family
VSPPPATRTIIAKLKPSGREPHRAEFSARGDIPPPTPRLARLLENERIRRIQSVFPEGVGSAFGSRVGLRRVRTDAPRAERLARNSRARDLVTIEVARGEDPRKMARHLSGLKGEVEYAYVPVPRHMFRMRKHKKRSQLDPLLSRQWGHSAVRIAEARKRANFRDAQSLTVAVADTGVDTTHPDLDGIISEYKNFVGGESVRDYEGHGTHVAGIIAAELNNGIGISGLCVAKILALKVLPTRVEWDAAAYYRALEYCIGRGRVLNLSLGAADFDPGERDVIADLIEAGVVVVAAMGNDYEDGNPKEYPAALPGVCAVGATDQADRRAGFSNTGRHIAISAPGVGIVSTTPTYKYAHGVSHYDEFDGSSMATPHVSAAAALVLAGNPSLTPAQVIRKLQRSADRVSGMKGRPSNSYGWGRLNIEAALR